MARAGTKDLHVADRVFFNVPAPLPRGRHELTRGQVQEIQRERLMIAVTELLAGSSYRETGIREITARAGVSRAAFYECFKTKEECVLAAYDRCAGVFAARLGAAAPQLDCGWEEFISHILDAYLSTLQQDLVVARAFHVEMDAVGTSAREHRRNGLEALSMLLRERCSDCFAEMGWPNPSLETYLAVVYAVRQITADALDTQAAPDLRALLPGLSERVKETLRGAVSASLPEPLPAIATRG